jgi:ElaB/YqjD/DUF883 family membrane-anchored ribosome-binding protein
MARQSKNEEDGNATPQVAELEREIGQLVEDLETRLERLNSLAKQESKEVADEISEFVSDTIASVTDRVTARARSGARAAGDEATQIGSEALRRLASEVDQRPLLTLAIAAGVGFLAGLSKRA